MSEKKSGGVDRRQVLLAGASLTLPATPSAQTNGNGASSVRNLLSDQNRGTLVAAMERFDALTPQQAHAFLITQESGWSQWDTRRGQQTYRDPSQLWPATGKCNPANLPLRVGENKPQISTACAIGLTQVIPTTARNTIRDFNLPYSLEQVMYDPKANYTTGYLHFTELVNNLKREYPSYKGINTLALVAYNMGEPNLRANLRRFGRDPDDPDFDMVNFLRSLRGKFEETKEYPLYILGRNGFIDSRSVTPDARGPWLERRVDALKSLANLQAGLPDFTQYLAFRRERRVYDDPLEERTGNTLASFGKPWDGTFIIGNNDRKFIPGDNKNKFVPGENTNPFIIGNKKPAPEPQ